MLKVVNQLRSMKIRAFGMSSRPVGALGVHVGEEGAGPGGFGVEPVEHVAVQDARAVQHVGGAGDHDAGDGRLRADRAPVVEPDVQGLARHDAAHVCPHVLERLGARHLLGEDARLLVLVHDVEGLVDHPSLVFGQVEVDGVPGHGEWRLLAGGEGVLAAGLRVGLADGPTTNTRSGRHMATALASLTSASGFLTAESFRRLSASSARSSSARASVGRRDAAHGGEDVDSLPELQHEPPDTPSRQADCVVCDSHKNAGNEYKHAVRRHVNPAPSSDSRPKGEVARLGQPSRGAAADAGAPAD